MRQQDPLQLLEPVLRQIKCGDTGAASLLLPAGISATSSIRRQ